MSKKKKIICFDIDNTICKTVGSNYKNSEPILKNIKFINNLYEQGYTIKFFTARYMGRTNDNINKAKKRAKKITLNQLKKWKVKFNKIYFGKPSSDLYIDDKNLNFKKNWVEDLKKFLK
tara:strand:+ start:201 stop:557 length:357 start_codon:yes stop_codon:yes gene_type:complete